MQLGQDHSTRMRRIHSVIEADDREPVRSPDPIRTSGATGHVRDFMSARVGRTAPLAFVSRCFKTEMAQSLNLHGFRASELTPLGRRLPIFRSLAKPMRSRSHPVESTGQLIQKMKRALSPKRPQADAGRFADRKTTVRRRVE